MVNFKELNDSTGHRFEQMICHLLRSRGWNILCQPGIGPDGGKDIIASITETYATGKSHERKYIIQCKDKSISGNNVLPSDIMNFQLTPSKHNTIAIHE